MFDDLVPLTTDSDLVAMVDALVQEAIRRQTWVFLLDDEQRALPIAIPMDGVPADPAPAHVAKLADRIRQLIEHVPDAASAVLVWERPGGPDLHMLEADWMSALAAAGAPVRAQLLMSDEGARLVDAEFEAITAS